MFRYYMKRILTSRMFWLCMAISLFTLLYPCRFEWEYCRMDPGTMPVLYLLSALGFEGVYTMIVPILTSAPFMLVFTEELKEKVVYYQMIRAGRRHYYRDQILSAIGVGAIIGGISYFIWFVLCLAFGAVLDNSHGHYSLLDGTVMESIAHSDGIVWLTIWYILLYVFYCLYWSLIGMALSLVTKNKYVLIAAPFIIYLVWEYVTQMLYSVSKVALFFNPGSPMMNGTLEYLPSWKVEYSVLYPILCYVILIGGLGGLYYIVTKRRFLREGL